MKWVFFLLSVLLWDYKRKFHECIAFCAKWLFFFSKVQWCYISFWQEQPPLYSHCVWNQQLLRWPRGNVWLVRDRGTVNDFTINQLDLSLFSQATTVIIALEQVTHVWGIIKPKDFTGLWCSVTQRNLLTKECDVMLTSSIPVLVD